MGGVLICGHGLVPRRIVIAFVQAEMLWPRLRRLRALHLDGLQGCCQQLRIVHVGPSDYVPWLTDRKWAHIRLEGRTFGDVPLNLELKLEVWDSPNSAGVVIDAVRCVRLALDRGLSGALEGPSAYFMKSPPVQFRDDVARHMVEAFIAEPASRVEASAPARLLIA